MDPDNAQHFNLNCFLSLMYIPNSVFSGAQWLIGRVLDSRLRCCGFETHRRHCVVVLEQDVFILATYWFNPGRPVPVYLKDC